MNRFFFYCVPPSSPEQTPYHHLMVCLGEGLKELGAELYANIDYWQLQPGGSQFLFQHQPEVSHDDCAVVIFDSHWLAHGNLLPEHLFHAKRQYITVYLDDADGNRTFTWEPEFRQFDFILRTHYSSKFKHPGNVYPWAFGLSQRMISATHHITDFSHRKRCLMVNFRDNPRYPHSVRQYFRKHIISSLETFIPVDTSTDQLTAPSSDPEQYLLWAQTGRRHYASYYSRLINTAACACLGGCFEFPWNTYRASRLNYGLRRVLKRFDWTTSIVTQWDSWRLWESFAAGCTTFHLDFEKYGFVLPVMPTNWKHYVGIDLDNIQYTVKRISDEPEILEEISLEGRRWALENYSSLAVTQRFIQLLQTHSSFKCTHTSVPTS